MTINKGAIANICVLWCFALLLGITLGLNVPFVLLVIATILYLV